MVGTKNGSHRTDVESQEGHKKKDRRPTESGDYWEVFQGKHDYEYELDKHYKI